nr:hypothetical protein GCM10025699_27690 [Microbacterium flavescens]
MRGVLRGECGRGVGANDGGGAVDAGDVDGGARLELAGVGAGGPHVAVGELDLAAVPAHRREHATVKVDERVDVRLRGILAAAEAAQQGRTEEQDEHRGHDAGDDHLQPDRRTQQARAEARETADAQHQEGEIERQHLDHQEGQDQHQPPDPGPVFDRLDELHDVPP